MAKKVSSTPAAEDLFADFGLPAEGAGPGEKGAHGRPGAQEAPDPAPAGEGGSPVSGSLQDGARGGRQRQDAAGGLPAVLGDGQPPEKDGELTLARYAARAYLEYALSVVKSRALPDVFDGMKPVQRRILYAMERMRLMPPAKAVKCARVVGDVLGKYHPHGDQAAYDAMVRMAQGFTMRYPLVDGEGNFGSRDGDRPAAMRYTEARLTKISSLLLSELDSGDVDYIPNYDGSFREPSQLPARMPFVLLNGASGIAVGMATEIPSHNLVEVGEAVLLLLDNPAATLDEILAVLPAPDFPGGGQIITPAAEIRQVYASGRGSLRVRARYHFEELQRSQWQLVVDELPPAASAESVLSQVEEVTSPRPRAGRKSITAEQQQARASLLSVLGAVRNECDRDTPMRIVFEPRTSRIDRDLFVSTLLAQASLESNAPMNLVMIGADGRPAQKGLPAILSEWIGVRTAAVRRRTEARLARVLARLAILAGRLIAIDNLDRVIAIIRFEERPRERLMEEFSLTDVQAEDILELRLRQLANLEVQKIIAEQGSLEAERGQLEKILGSERALRGVLARETREAMKAFGDARRTLVKPAEKAAAAPAAAPEEVTVVISRKGYVRSRGGHGHDASLMSFKMGDALLASFECMSDGILICIGSTGRSYSVPVSQLPGARGDGLPVTSFIELEAGSEITGYLAGPEDAQVVLANDAGFGLKCVIADLVARVRTGKAFMKLEAGACMLQPRLVSPDENRLACLSGEGRLLAFPLEDLRRLPEGGRGVTLMALNPGEKLLSALPAGSDGCLVTGRGRSRQRTRLLQKGQWQVHFGNRARKGRQLEIRFAAESLSRPPRGAAAAESPDAETEPQPSLL